MACYPAMAAAARWAKAFLFCSCVAEALIVRSAQGGEAFRAEASAPIAGPSGLSSLLAVLQHFKRLAQTRIQGATERQEAQAVQLDAAASRTQDPTVLAALQKSSAHNAQSLLETRQLYMRMAELSSSMERFIGPAASASSGCGRLACGAFATCTETASGPQCVCNEGYVGIGSDCHAPPELLPRPLFAAETDASTTRAMELGICQFDDGLIAIVFRDEARDNAGRMVIGSVSEAGAVQLGLPEQFTPPGVGAFGPVVSAAGTSKLVLAWRDADRNATGWLRGAVATGSPQTAGAELVFAWGDPVDFSMAQANKMALVDLPRGRVAVLYADHSQSNPFGGAVLATVGRKGEASIFGQYRFLDSAVCRLAVAKVSASSFVLAVRAGAPLADDLEDPSSMASRQALAIFGEMVDDELVFDPDPANLAPESKKIWARSVALVAPNTVAYAFQDENDHSTKMAVLRVRQQEPQQQASGAGDDESFQHEPQQPSRLQVIQKPVIVGNGFTPYLEMLSAPYTATDPHTVICHEQGNRSVVSVCSWDQSVQSLARCQDFPWMASQLVGAAGVRLNGGRALVAVATPSGTPYLSLFGLSKQ